MKHLLLFVSVIASISVNAQWSTNPSENLPLTHLLSNSRAPSAVTDTKGGVYVVWTNTSIVGQKLDAAGNIQFTSGGQSFGSSGGGVLTTKENPITIPDGSGGVITAWAQATNFGIFASRVKADGKIAWDKTVYMNIGYQSNPAIATDGEGGVYITWQDTRKGNSNSDIYAQRINADGNLMWDTNGILVCAAVNNQINPGIVSDGKGGAFISWDDQRKPTHAIYAQRINSLGIPYWQADGIPVCANSNDPAGGSKIAATDEGEAIVAWTNGSAGGTWNIYAQKLNLEKVVWATNGVPICDAPLSQTNPELVANGSGGAIICWRDTRRGISNEQDIYAQSVSTGGVVNWQKNGIPVCTEPKNPAAKQKMVSDGNGGAIIAWEDYRNDKFPDIYAQKVNKGGGSEWEPNGVAVCIAPSYQMAATLAEDGKGGAIIAWADYRNSSTFVIYTQYINPNGKLGVITSVNPNLTSENIYLEQNYPNPWKNSTVVRLNLPNALKIRLSMYNTFGQQTVQIFEGQLPAGKHEFKLNKNKLTPGTYFYRLQAENTIITRKMILQ